MDTFIFIILVVTSIIARRLQRGNLFAKLNILFGKMFNKNFASHQQKDAAAEDFGFGLVTTSEDISDAQTNH